MKVGFVAEPYEETGASGMGYMVLELMRQLPLAAKGHEITIYSSTPIKKSLIRVPVKNVIVPSSLVGKLHWFLKTDEDIDVLFFVAPLLTLVVPRRIKAVVICPEPGSQKINPGSFKEKVIAIIRDRILMPRCIARAYKIITISNATKQDIMKFYKVPSESIRVIYIGFQDLSPYKDTVQIDAKLKPYFFFTGRAKPRKNVHGIVSAFIVFKKRTGFDCKLVIAGKATGGYREMVDGLITEAGYKEDVQFVGYVSTEQLCAYYKNAVALVFPSFNEGFGMPVLEAMSLGTPVVTSNISSLPEVAGNAALLVNPHDPEDISRAMEKVFTDAEAREEMVSRGYVQARKFSWSHAVQAYAQLLDELASNR